ncbi:MAG: sigma-70 family RNA polymerase sigma factor [Myxococcaceae bacterium]|nr:sigma-70 family RNA polymerase sigma factor [Myxococcaceae bacterium]
MNATNNERTWLETKWAAMKRAPLSAEVESGLAKAWQRKKDRDALEQLIEAHLGLVAHTARRLKGYGVPLDELMAEGNMGLLRAVDRFEDRNVRFRTYAAFWVRAYMLAYALRQKSIVTAATGAVGAKLFFKLRSARAKLETRLGPDAEEIDSLLAKQFGLTVEQIRAHTARLSGSDVSLDEHAGDESDATRGELLPDMGATPDELAYRAQRDGAVRGVIGELWERLDERERAVLEQRLMAGEDEVTLAELGKGFSLSRERLRQIESKLKAKVKKALAADLRVLH